MLSMHLQRVCCIFVIRLVCFDLQNRVEIRGGSRRSKRISSKQMAKPRSKPLPTTTLMAAATLMTSLTNPDLAWHAEQEKRAEHEKWRGLGAACMKFDRMLQQASTNEAEWVKNKLIVKRMQKRVASLRKHVKKIIIIDDVCISPNPNPSCDSVSG